MVIIRGNSSKNRVILDVNFDVLELTNTLTQDKHILEATTPSSVGRLYYQALVDFKGLEVSEYEYSAKLSGKVVQTGLLTIEPFDESEEPVQVIVPTDLSRKVITYQN